MTIKCHAYFKLVRFLLKVTFWKPCMTVKKERKKESS
jgi:hypothetical protein